MSSSSRSNVLHKIAEHTRKSPSASSDYLPNRFVSGHDFSRAITIEWMRALAPEVRFISLLAVIRPETAAQFSRAISIFPQTV
jgi:hypothetical protein